MMYVPALSFRDSLLFDVVCALTVHKIYNKYEVEPANFPATLSLLVGVPALPCYFLTTASESTWLATFLAYGLFYVTLVLSIVLYRLSPVHPLGKYPGPISLKVSKFVAMYHTAGGKRFVFFKDLHDKYGPFVRVGPNELSVIDVEAIQRILGLRKGPLWIAHYKPGTTPSIAALRNLDLHRERRKLWNHGFTTAALKGLQPAVENRVAELVGELGKRASSGSGGQESSVDLAQWMNNLAYDIMGDMVLGGGFSLLENGDEDGLVAMLEDSIRIIGTLEHTPWIVGLIYKLFMVPERQQKFEEFVIQCYDMRREQGSTKRDLFHYITNEEGLDNMEVSKDQGVNDLNIAIGAGSDTTSTVLGGLFFYLLSNPGVFDRLRKEVDSEFPLGEEEPFDSVKLAGMPYLNAVINETLRLQPPVPVALQRSPLEGSGGEMIAGRFIPENTALDVPPYVIHRDPRYFSPSPGSFIPERWLDSSAGKFTTNASAFIPFAAGPGGCAGKNLALLEMRMVVAFMVQRFDMKFAEGYNPRRWEEDLRDFFVMQVGELPVVLYARK
ncbi:hypothetical protein ACEPAH_4353 [Sanghuangporus vaninii]